MANNNDQDPIVPMGFDYSTLEDDDWEAEDFIQNLPAPRHDFHTLIRGVEHGIPIHNKVACEHWLFIVNAHCYGYRTPSEVHPTLGRELHSIAECLRFESNVHKLMMKTPQGVKYTVIDRPLLWYMFINKTDTYGSMPFALCINSIVQDFILLSIDAKADCHRRAYELSTYGFVSLRVRPRPHETRFTFRTTGPLNRVGVSEAVDFADADP